MASPGPRRGEAGRGPRGGSRERARRLAPAGAAVPLGGASRWPEGAAPWRGAGRAGSSLRVVGVPPGPRRPGLEAVNGAVGKGRAFRSAAPRAGPLPRGSAAEARSAARGPAAGAWPGGFAVPVPYPSAGVLCAFPLVANSAFYFRSLRAVVDLLRAIAKDGSVNDRSP